MHKKTHERIAGRLAELRETSDSEVKRVEEVVQEAKAYAETLVETVREPLLVLDGDLRVVSANRSFCQTFQVSPEETKGHLIYELGSNQWDIPRLRVLLEEMLPRDTQVQDFEVDHEFPVIGRRAMVLNAHRIFRNNNGTSLILLALEDITERQQAEEALGEARDALERQLQERTADLRAASEQLQREITERQQAEEALEKTREALEKQLQERTADLRVASEQLQREITERQQAEEALCSLEELIENEVQIIQDRLVAFGRDFHITFWGNKATQEI
ncbi:MAG: PAS domain S-box protein [bacterium]|nr:PAS domain S-box protein [bacterium]